MMAIGLIDANDQVAEALLEGRTYFVGMHWNETSQMWTLSLRDYNGNGLIHSVACLSQKALLLQFRRPGLPPGELMIDSPAQVVLTRRSFAEGSAILLYASAEEMISAGFTGYEAP